jgi:hypothetical protein
VESGRKMEREWKIDVCSESGEARLSFRLVRSSCGFRDGVGWCERAAECWLRSQGRRWCDHVVTLERG